MPAFRLFDRPRSHGLEDFDQLERRLRIAVADPQCFAEVWEALEVDGRLLDVHQLASDLHLDPSAVEIVEQLAVWGYQGELLHEFGSVCIATITAGSLLGHVDLSTFIFARRRRRGLVVVAADENGWHAELGEFGQPLFLFELVVVIDSVLLRQAPYDVSGGDWRSGYLGDSSMTLRVSSAYYPELSIWYHDAVEQWIDTYGVDK